MRFLTASLFAIAMAAASSAAAEDLSLAALLARGACPEVPICGNCKADIADGATETPDDVQSPSEDQRTSVQGPYQLAPRADAAESPAARDATPGGAEPQAGLLLPAIQRAHESAAPPSPGEPAQVMPEMPICANCGADAVAQPGPAATPQQRRRGGFALSIGGVTLSSNGGVQVAVGDVNGDGREHRSQAARNAAGGSASSAPRR